MLAKIAETRKAWAAAIGQIVLIGAANDWTFTSVADVAIEVVVAAVVTFFVWRVTNR